jgi:hypothetical protein
MTVAAGKGWSARVVQVMTPELAWSPSQAEGTARDPSQ